MSFLGIDVDVDDVFLVVGIVATVGTAGGGAWITGLLNVTGAEKIVVEEAMKAAVGIAGNAIKTGKVDATPGGFVDGWKGQAIYRAKAAATAAGPAAASAFMAQVAAVTGPEAIDFAKNSWETYKRGEAYARDPELATRGYLDEQIARCRAATGGACRPDAVAAAANLANGAFLFDPSDWDPVTGAPPPLAATQLTVAQAQAAFLEEVRRAGTADAPGPQQALAVVNAAKRIAAGRAERAALRPAADEKLGQLAGDGAIKRLPGGEGQGSGSLLGAAFLAAVFSAPYWFPALRARMGRR